jgi:hypothetical protein
VLHGATLALLLAATVVVGCAHGPRANPATRSALAEAETALKRRDYDAASAAYDRAVAAATATADRTLARRERAEARLFMGDLAGAEVDLPRWRSWSPMTRGPGTTSGSCAPTSAIPAARRRR